MGAKNCPETPRQKMIGMMYLVLTAMLALNVSKDIVNAFVIVDDALIKSKDNTMLTIESDYSHLKRQLATFPEKVGDAMVIATALRKESDEMVQYIENLRSELLIAADKTDKNPDGTLKTAKGIGNKEDYSKSTNFLINQGNAKKLKDEMLKYRTSILSLLPDKGVRLKGVIGLNVDDETLKNRDGQNETWEDHNFNHIVLVACVTLLNKMIGEVRNAESMILKQVIAGIGEEDFKFDNIGGKAIPNARMVFAGDNYDADIIVTAYDSKSTPKVYYKIGVDTLRFEDIGSAQTLDGSSGVAKLKLAASSTGDQKYAGLIVVTGPDGEPKPYSFKDKYTVVRPSATVAADKMNVLYSGIENPVSISAPVDPAKLNLSMPGCNAVSNGGGKYTVTVPASLIGRTVTATVSSNDGSGSKVMGTSEFRVKSVPDPRPFLGANISGGRRTKAEITANPVLIADMGKDFVYDLRWTVTSYKAVFIIRNVEDPPIAIAGNRFTDDLTRKINAATAGTVILFTDIRARSSAGDRLLPEITIRIR